MWMYLKERTTFFEQSFHVLHIAPEACFIKRFEKIHGDHYITADIESPLAKVKMDIHQIPFQQNTFDAVLCNHVLEHVRDDIKAISEINRVLKPGGFAILQVPFFNPVGPTTFEDPTITDKRQREKIFGQDDHVRKYGEDYPDRIKKGGLQPIIDHYIDEISSDVRKKFGLTQGEIVYGGKKVS